MFKRLWYKFKNLFRKDEPAPIPTQNDVPDSDILDVPVEVPTPTNGARIIDYVNNGTPKNPDHTFLFDNLKIDTDKVSTVSWYANKFKEYKPIYSKITEKIGVPEWFIFLLHIRESSLNFSKVLHNGQTLSHVNKYGTTWVPKGRGKGLNWTWTDAAIDALKLKKYHEITDWTLKNILPKLEAWNGLGYRYRIGDRGQVEYSPFIVAGSNFHDETSKYVSDGKYNKNAVEKQLGVYTILKGLELQSLVDLK